MISICRTFWFSASHVLPNHEGACKRQHGHNYKLEVKIMGKIAEEGSAKGMVMDFGDLDKIVMGSIVDVLDHRHLNDFFNNPTAENMVENMATRIQIRLEVPIQVTKIRLWETEKCYAEWTPDD